MRRRTLTALGSALVSGVLLIPLSLYIRRDKELARRRHPHRPTSQTKGTGFEVEWGPRRVA